ncbi:type II secretion system protein [uncultured Clostridium sp.]|uniref:type II secretion system protein n=1 Tax=uncultured Clostridium sp. TaxID=59620 RepID=UPI0028F13BE9|nr:type II secretion system protein [uncultured Clostridium sp.]
MINIKIKINSKKKGFTLIELLLVMSIMIIFMSMLIPKFKGYSAKANYIKADNIARQIYSAAMISYAESNGKFESDKIKGNIEELIGIISEKDEDYDLAVNTSNDNALIWFKISDQNYCVNIDNEGYKLEVKSRYE